MLPNGALMYSVKLSMLADTLGISSSMCPACTGTSTLCSVHHCASCWLPGGGLSESLQSRTVTQRVRGPEEAGR